ncbi:hypothetical protein [Francisella orientalis]|uniref:hypothetical protein n=1 Tax=Francisella orientalis TaxID=299583 RepID=UPI001C5736FE|nr:hypothetical protein [Francisella orientalis]
MKKVVAFWMSDAYYMSSPADGDVNGRKLRLLRYLRDILYTNTLLKNLSISS